VDPSHVLLAMGHDQVRSKNSVRLSLGRQTTSAEVKKFLMTVKEVRGTFN
jgi:cysteine sulfinate desulfinase/cysteine desulfurase-like protein